MATIIKGKLRFYPCEKVASCHVSSIINKNDYRNGTELDYDGEFRLAFARHPLDRLVSSYHYHIKKNHYTGTFKDYMVNDSRQFPDQFISIPAELDIYLAPLHDLDKVFDALELAFPDLIFNRTPGKTNSTEHEPWATYYTSKQRKFMETEWFEEDMALWKCAVNNPIPIEKALEEWQSQHI